MDKHPRAAVKIEAMPTSIIRKQMPSDPKNQKRIAVIAWGSLIHDRRDLQLRTNWSPTGPTLPVEFCRVTSISGNNPVRLTLVLLPGADPITTYWAELDYPDIHTARLALADAEGTTGRRRLEKIGMWSCDGRVESRLDIVNQQVGDWAASRNLDGAVWTDLPPNFPKPGGGTYEAFDESLPKQVIAHFRRYEADTTFDESWFPKAREYVETAPRQTSTRCRAALEAAFGWQPHIEI